MLVPIKQLKASFILHTIGSPRTLKDVFTIKGKPDNSKNFFIKS